MGIKNKIFWDHFEDFMVDYGIEWKNLDKDFDLLLGYFLLFKEVVKKDVKFNEEGIYKLLIPFKELGNDKLFCESLKEVIEKEKNIQPISNKRAFLEEKRKQSIKQKQFVKQRVFLSFLPLNLVIHSMNEEQVFYIRKTIKRHISDLSKNIDADKVISAKVLQEIAYDNSYNYAGKFKAVIDKETATEFYGFLKYSSAITTTSFLLLFSFNALSQSLKKQVLILRNGIGSEENPPSLRIALNTIFQLIYKIDTTVDVINRNLEDQKKWKQYFNNYIKLFESRNESNVFYILGKMCSGLNPQQKKSFANIILEKIEKSSVIKEDMEKNCEQQLSFFCDKKKSERETEWSNKVYLNTIKTLSYLQALSRAHNDSWKIRAAVNELALWVIEIDKIINAFELEDDWEKIEKYLSGESDNIEWKSSFKIPTESGGDVSGKPRELQEEIFQSIIKNIIAMANTSGGIILVGLIEYPERIKNSEVQKNIIQKKGFCFFNIETEFKMLGIATGEDEITRELLQKISKITEKSKDYFNAIFRLSPIRIYDEKNRTNGIIYSIEVNKSSEPLFTIQREGEKINVSFLKRANKTICYGDPRSILIGSSL